MKKIIIGLIGLSGLLGIGLSLNPVSSVSVRAEEEIVETGSVVINQTEHGSIVADKTEGNVGDVITLNVSNDFLYLIDSVTVNGVSLVESEKTKGVYSFVLVAGENVVSATFVIDSETLGVFSDMAREASEKDWANLFSIENVITIIKWVLDGGILLAMVSYFIKDKKLSKKVEDKVEETISKIIPDTTKETVVSTVETVIAPVVSNLQSKMVDIGDAMKVFSKCMALAQENTPESRKAIIDELSTVKIGDAKTLEEVKAYIEQYINETLKSKEESLKVLEDITVKNEKIIEEKVEEEHSEEKEVTYDGTSI